VTAGLQPKRPASVNNLLGESEGETPGRSQTRMRQEPTHIRE